MNERDWRPRYVQVAEELRDQISRGELAPEQPLPSEPELADRYNLSRTSVRNAIRLLKDWGLVRSEQGRGTYVRAPRHRVRRRNTERYQWEKTRVHASEAERRNNGGTEHDTGLTVDALDFHADYTQLNADEDLAAEFEVEAGTPVLRRIYWTKPKTEAAPLSVSHSYLLIKHIEANPRLLDATNEPWPGGTQHQLSTVGIEVDTITDEIAARPPYPDEAQLLDIEPGTAVITMRKVSRDTAGRVVEVAHVIFPGDRTELIYTTQLERWTT